MADRRDDRGPFFWSTAGYGAALVAGVIVGLLVAWLYGEMAAGVIVGAVVFMVLGYILTQHFGPDAAESGVVTHDHGSAAPLARPAVTPAPAAPRTVVAETPPAAEATAPVGTAPAEPPLGGVSERVREAARAAGEAARAASGSEGGVAAAKPEAEIAPARLMDAPPAPATPVAGERPTGLEAARDGKADDLKRIKGVGPKLEELLHSLGFYHFDQIAAWTAAEIAWVDSNLEGFNGRATRDDWVGQARLLAAGGETEFSKRVDRGEVY